GVSVAGKTFSTATLAVNTATLAVNTATLAVSTANVQPRMSKREKTDVDLEEEEQLRVFLYIIPDEEKEVDYAVLDKSWRRDAVRNNPDAVSSVCENFFFVFNEKFLAQGLMYPMEIILLFLDLRVMVPLLNLITALAVVKNGVPKMKGLFSSSLMSRIMKSTG
nr:hypothetical protein [Tanacetum cinerariifolium]